LIGTIIKRRSFISLYNTVVWSHLAFNIAAGAYFIYTLFHQIGEDDLNNCFFSYFYDNTSQDECEEEFQTYRVVIICVYIFFCLLELCASSSLPPPPQPFLTACGRICLPIYEQVFVSSLPVTSHSLGKRRRRTIRHPLRRMRLYLRWLRHITTEESMCSLSQLDRTMYELDYRLSCTVFFCKRKKYYGKCHTTHGNRRLNVISSKSLTTSSRAMVRYFIVNRPCVVLTYHLGCMQRLWRYGH
jgi:hypothetical protein